MADVEVKLETVISSGLDGPLYLTAPSGDDRLFVVEQRGTIRIYKNESLKAAPYLDLSDKVYTSHESGLLGLAFHPEYGANGRFFVYYTTLDARCGGGDGVRSTVAEYVVSPGDPDIADTAETIILELCQPTDIHNGGMLAFGPEGYLFIGLGDGGWIWDGWTGDSCPVGRCNAQNKRTLLGSLLRIDVNSTRPYAVPADNPFVGIDGADEIYAMGFRNPWRFSIDGHTVYVGDVGESNREEIDVFSLTDPGLNFGWPRFEGTLCVKEWTSETTCDADGMTFPVLEFRRSISTAIVGGYVYRGSALALDGYYFYGDFVKGFIRSALIIDGVARHHKDWTSTFGAQPQLASFGVDGHGELYLISLQGTVKKLVPDI